METTAHPKPPFPIPQPSTHTHKMVHTSLSGSSRNTTSLCDLYFFYLDRIKTHTLPNSPFDRLL